jgi:hypothetical protein
MTARPFEATEFIQGTTLSIERLTEASDEIRGVIMREVPDQDACLAALTLVERALCVAIHAVPRLTEPGV